MTIKRVIIIVIDACGVGALPDAHLYGDQESSTIPHVADAVGGLRMTHSARLGLGNVVPIKGVDPTNSPAGWYGKMAEVSPGKDSTTGHWEIAGVVLDQPFPVFPDGFPLSLVREFELKAKIKAIGNIAASGTDIIDRFGVEQMSTGSVILYTSADSVFQLAAHESVIPLDRLYEICAIARELCREEFAVGRVIARPFIGEPGSFVRSAGRRDFSLFPPSLTLLDVMTERGLSTLSIGKIWDLFAERGISEHIKTANNSEGIAATIDAIASDASAKLIFTNLVDFDQLWGHRNDPHSFARALEEFDARLGQIVDAMKHDDMLIVTADHGCDPTLTYSTDHTREYVPLLVYGMSLRSGGDLGTRSTFADVASTISDLFKLNHSFPGTSFAHEIGAK